MAKRLKTADAVAYLAAHPSSVSDTKIAALATKRMRVWGLTAPKEYVSRPLVSMLRRGKTNGTRGLRARAVWETMAQLKLIPRVPADIPSREALAARRNRRDFHYQRAQHLERRLRALLARLRGGELEDVKEIPVLTVPTLRYFGFDRNPVFDEMQSERDLWWGAQHKEARAELVAAAEAARFVRLAGARGAGKSLVARAAKRELEARKDVIICEPSAAITGVLTEGHLITSVIQAIKRHVEGRDEVYAEAQSPAKRALAMRYLLVQQKRDGRKIVLWIDEAHQLRASTFLALKRFLDEVDAAGRRLLGVILIGQNPEAAYDPRTRDLSEVTLRLETYRVGPMNDEMADYLRFKIQRAGGAVSEVITPSALKAIAARCPYPLDANALFAQLLIDAYGDRRKPISRDMVDAAPEAETVDALMTAAGE